MAMPSSAMQDGDGLPTYRCISVTQRGGLDGIAIVEKKLRLPNPGEARIRVLASPVVRDDVAVRIGNRPFLPKLPFTPGYSFVGIVDAIGDGVRTVEMGDRVAALVQFGGHAEMAYWPADDLVRVPKNLDPAEAVVLILNYLVAYQILHRVAHVKAGDRALIIGASGGVGTAFLQLGNLAGLKTYGLASVSKHHVLRKYGATPIDYRVQDFVAVIKEAEPDGIDFVFNGMAEESFGPAMSVLRRGGVLVHYGGPQSLLGFLRLMLKYVYYNLLPNGKRIEGYGTHRLGAELFKPDWASLFGLLAAGDIQPILAARFPILEARAANELLESGQVAGAVVLVASESGCCEEAYFMDEQAAGSGWKDLCLLGGFAAVLLEVILILSIVGYFVWPYTPGTASTETVFALLQSDPLGGVVSLDLLLLIGNLVGLPVFAALYVSLKPINRSYALMALLIGVIAIALIVPARPILEMVSLSRLYSGADPVAQGRILAAGDAVLAAFNGTSWAVNTFLGGLSLFISSVLMFRSEIYGRLTAYVGLVTNAAACGFFLPGIGTILLFLTLPGYMVWCALLAVRLVRAARI